MIEIHPASSSELAELGTKADCVLFAFEGGNRTGSCELAQAGECIELLSLSFADEPTGELLIRGALSYGDNHGAVSCETECDEHSALLQRIGFSKSDKKLSIKINKVVHYLKRKEN